MVKAYFRRTENIDPEESLEEAALAKAFYDEYRDDLVIQKPGEKMKHDAHFFGRLSSRSEFEIPLTNRVIPYWNDDTFQKYAQRETWICDLESAEKKVIDLHNAGKGAFFKSMRTKEMTCAIPIGTTLHSALGDMIWSFIDCDKIIMIQQLMEMQFEQRFFIVDGEVITWSPVAPDLTPLDSHTLKHEEGNLYRLPKDSEPVYAPDKILLDFAKKVARECKHFSIIIDCAWIDGQPGIIEYNDGHVGQFGLYACDVRKIARATRKIVARPFKGMSK